MRVKEIKSLLLKKGWAGRTISRSETVARLNPLLKQHVTLANLYEQVTNLDEDLSTELQGNLRRLRLDMGKLAETVFSCGGVAYSGVDHPKVQPVDNVLLETERALHNALLQERRTINHQMRTEAVLQHCLDSCGMRLEFLNKYARRFRNARAVHD